MTFYKKKHEEYLANLEKTKELESIGYYLRDHLKIAAGYWCLTGMETLKVNLEPKKKDELIQLFTNSQNKDGGFGGNINHDSHITSTHYAILVLGQWGCLNRIDVEGVVDYVRKLQIENGGFMGDVYGEIDTRFSYCGLATLKLLDRINVINLEKAIEYVLSCNNFDGGFGGMPNAESHGAYVFCCVGALAIAGALNRFDKNALSYWLSRRQTVTGGFNGRPEKLPDVCYSWWI